MNRRSRRRRTNKNKNQSVDSSIPLRYFAKPRTILKPNSPRFQSNHQRNLRASLKNQSSDFTLQEPIQPRPPEEPHTPHRVQPRPPKTEYIPIVPPSEPCPITARRINNNCAPSNLNTFFDMTLNKSKIEKGLYIKHTCMLCDKHFSLNDLVILTCGHIFHKECLMMFRKNSNPRNHFCPTCHELYHFVEIKAQDTFPNIAAILIQKVFRGFIFRQHLGENAPKGSTLHKKWILNRAKTASTLLVDAIENQSDTVDAILASIDKELDWARNVMSQVDVQEKEINWENVKLKIVIRGCDSCPICLREVSCKDCMMTSCEHFFHPECLKKWLLVCQDQNIPTTCPVCRSPFQFRRLYEMDKLDVINAYNDNMTREEFKNYIHSDFSESNS